MEVKQQLTWWIRILEHVLNSQLFLLRTANKASEIKKVRQTHNTRKERTEAESVYCLDQNSSFWCVYFQIKKKKIYIYIFGFPHWTFFEPKKNLHLLSLQLVHRGATDRPATACVAVRMEAPVTLWLASVCAPLGCKACSARMVCIHAFLQTHATTWV